MFPTTVRGQVSLEFLLLGAALAFMMGILLPAYTHMLDAQSAFLQVQHGNRFSEKLNHAIEIVSFSPVGTARKIGRMEHLEMTLTIFPNQVDVIIFPNGLASPKTFAIYSSLALEDHRSDENGSFLVIRKESFISLESLP